MKPGALSRRANGRGLDQLDKPEHAVDLDTLSRRRCIPPATVTQQHLADPGDGGEQPGAPSMSIFLFQ
jgi:hypothetical protein